MFNRKKKKENLPLQKHEESGLLQNIDEIGINAEEKVSGNVEETAEQRAEKCDETDEKEDSDMMSAFEAWLEDSMPDADRREAAKTAMNLVREAVDTGDYDDAIFDVICKGSDYDRAVAEASAAAEAKGREEGMEEGRRQGFEEGLGKGLEEGEIKGRNAGIEEYFNKSKGDGVPHPGSGSSRRASHAPSIFDLARSAF